MVDNPLITSAWSKYLTLTCPKEAFENGLNHHKPECDDLENFVRSWIAEGIPYCFKGNAMLYEKIRAFIATRLRIKPEDIRCCGSAKVGFSLSPHKFPKDFSNLSSDLDIFVISEDLFERLVGDYREFLDHYKRTDPIVSDYVKNLIDENIQTLSRLSGTIARGFIDSNKIPYLKNEIFGENLRVCNETLSDLIELLKQNETDFTYGPNKMTLRAYKNYDSAVQQNRLSVKALIDR